MIKSAFRSVFIFPDDMLRLFKNRYPAGDAVLLLCNYASLAVRAFFEWPAPGKVKRTRVCGYKVRAFSHRSVFFLFREIFIGGEYNFRVKGSGFSIMDCGANIGLATLFFKWRYPGSTVHAFEPDPETFALLEKNMRDNGLEGVFLHNIAVGRTDGQADFFMNAPVPGSLRMSVNRKRAEGRHIRVPMKRLSPFITENRTLLKIDTEGSETEIMRELENSGALAGVEQMVVEYHHRIGRDRSELSVILGILEKAGFQYQLGCANDSLTIKDVFQNVMIFAYRD